MHLNDQRFKTEIIPITNEVFLTKPLLGLIRFLTPADSESLAQYRPCTMARLRQGGWGWGGIEFVYAVIGDDAGLEIDHLLPTAPWLSQTPPYDGPRQRPGRFGDARCEPFESTSSKNRRNTNTGQKLRR